MANDDLAERVTDLEVKLAYQDHTLVALDEVVRDLATKVAALEAELGTMRTAAVPPAVDAAASATSE
jgi:uncharacterized coiled-coil protein SlyX